MSSLGEWADQTLAPNGAEAPAEDERAPELHRFEDSDEAMAWYNGWLKTLEPPDPPLDPEYGWDPVIRWTDEAGRPLYWYVVGTGGESSLVIEAASVVTNWANEYYDHYAALNSPEEADALFAQGGLPELEPPPLPPSTPEAEWIIATRGLARAAE